MTMTTTQLLFVRHEGVDVIDALMVVGVDHDGRFKDPREAFNAVRDAVTAWMVGSADGREAWEQSGEDFNIGDLLAGGCSGSLRPFLEDRGISDLRADYQLGENEEVHYDTVLPWREALP
jgi:hypothetical protein